MDPVLLYDCETVGDLVHLVESAKDVRSGLRDAEKPDDECSSPCESRHETKLFPQRVGDPIRLTTDDWVPNSMLLVLGYPVDLTSCLPDAIRRGLDAFPHLAGSITGDVSPFDLKVVADHRGVIVEEDDNSSIELEALSAMSQASLVESFLPESAQANHQGHHKAGFLRHPLLAAKVTRVSGGGCVLGFLVSHLLVDGAGLSMMVNRCRDSANVASLPPLNHDRSVIDRIGIGSDPIEELPDWYSIDRDLGTRIREWELVNSDSLATLRVTDHALEQVSGIRAGDWFGVTASFCRLLYRVGGYREAAFWCDVRGELGIPRDYTGNVGCYWHEDIAKRDETTDELAERLRDSLMRENGDRAARLYRTLKQHETRGIAPRWNGTDPGILPVNLVPYPAAAMDLGGGPPTFARMLTRNVHGLRISRTVANDGFIVEASLPSDLADSLADACRAEGLAIAWSSLES